MSDPAAQPTGAAPPRDQGRPSRAKPLGDREQRFAYYAAAFGALASVGLWAPSFDTSTGIALAGIGLFMSGFLAVTARSRKRLATGLASVLLSFGPWSMAWVVGLPFLALTGFLMLKSGLFQPRPARETDGTAEVAARPVRESRRRRRAAPDPSVETGPGARRPPPASKRYTPPTRRP